MLSVFETGLVIVSCLLSGYWLLECIIDSITDGRCNFLTLKKQCSLTRIWEIIKQTSLVLFVTVVIVAISFGVIMALGYLWLCIFN